MRALCVILGCALLAAGCLPAPQGHARAQRHPYTVVTTTGMVGDIVRQVAGTNATVRGLIGEGVDPHLYKPTRTDVAALLEADVVIYSGLLLEGKMTGVLEKIARFGKPVRAVTEALPASYLLPPAGMEGHHDPHVWMDVGAWIKAVDVVANILSEYDPGNASCYPENARRYAAELARLEAYARTAIASIPAQSRVLVTAHDAFNYFGRAYGIEVRGIQGLSTESEAGLEDISRLVALLVARDVRAVFVETSVADKNVRALLEGARSRGRDIRVGGSLFSDAMGAAGTYEGTYIGMIDHNVTVITRALGGVAPARGLNGKLTEQKHD